MLPLRRWLAEDRADPEAIAVCRPPVCGPGLVVGVVRLTGREADRTEAALADPQKLARALSIPKDPKAAIRAQAAAKRLEAGPARGFALALQRSDGSRPAHGAVLGQRFGPDLRLVMVIGEEAETVETTARRVARDHLGATGVVSLPFRL